MDNTFKGSEIIKFAVEIEKNGKAFYESVAGTAKNDVVKEAFQWLAKQEEKHRETFEKMLESADEHPQPESYPGEYYAYMKALVDENVFTKDETVKSMVQKSVTTAQAIRTGIGFEKDSILFFTEMKKYVPDSDQSIIDKLVDEEKVHLNKLTELRKMTG